MRIHRELRAIPITRSTEPAKLLEDNAALFLAPLPDLLDKFFPAKIVPRFLFLPQLALDHGLRRDAGVIGARKPHRGAPLKPRPANKYILNRIVEHVTHREHAGDIRRGNGDAVGRGMRRHLAREAAGLLPGGIPLLLNVPGFVTLGDFGHGAVRF